MTITIYHNPDCGTSRNTLAMIRQSGEEPEVIEYLKTPPDCAGLERILSMLDMEPRDLMRKKEAEYKEFGLDNPKLTREELVQAMVDHPKLIERPIVISNGRATIGRPPEKVLDMLR